MNTPVNKKPTMLALLATAIAVASLAAAGLICLTVLQHRSTPPKLEYTPYPTGHAFAKKPMPETNSPHIQTIVVNINARDFNAFSQAMIDHLERNHAYISEPILRKSHITAQEFDGIITAHVTAQNQRFLEQLRDPEQRDINPYYRDWFRQATVQAATPNSSPHTVTVKIAIRPKLFTSRGHAAAFAALTTVLFLALITVTLTVILSKHPPRRPRHAPLKRI